jgi:hypothetical protein
MKLGILLAASSFLSAMDPGCGAGVGANVANGPDTSVDGGGGGSGAGTGTAMTCGALGSHSFCEDFGGSAVLGAFDSQESANGTLSLDSALAASAPHSLLAATTHATGTTRTLARLDKKIATNATHFELSYSEYLDPSCVGPSDGVETGVIGLRGNTYWVAVRHGNPDTILETTINGGLYTQSHELKSSMPRGTWTKIALSVDVTTQMIALSVDGKVVVQNEPLHYPPGGSQPSQIAVGTLTDNLLAGPSACQVRIDDVTFDAI